MSVRPLERRLRRSRVEHPSLYLPLKSLVRWVIMPILTQTEIRGVEHIPKTGPFFLIPNHQSVLDPLLAQAACPRTVHSMTKSTQFSNPFMRWILPRIGSFPTRRYRVDPQTVRVALRELSRGRGVGIYPEGERSWDASMQPLRRGTVRLLLKAGVPIVPCGISGSYDVWPRWSRRPRRCPVRIRFGEPIEFGVHDDRASREAALPAATARLERAIRRLIDAVDLDTPDEATGRAGGPDGVDGVESWA